MRSKNKARKKIRYKTTQEHTIQNPKREFVILRFMRHKVPSILFSMLLLFFSTVLFAAAFPNPVLRFGSAALAFVALFPLALLITRISLIGSVFWGFAYGGISYMLHNAWLASFNPIAFFVVPTIYASYFALVFPCMKILYKAFPNSWFIFQPLLWLAYEYLRIQGFLGYSFGILGYALAFHPLLIQTADMFGVWILSLFIAFPAFMCAYLMTQILRMKQKRSTERPLMKNPEAQKNHILQRCIAILVHMARESRVCICTQRVLQYTLLSYTALSVFIIMYGYMAQRPFVREKASTPTVNMALVQHVKDPWQGGLQAYSESLETLISLTHEVMHSEKKPDIVVWSETAFVPSIHYHTKYRQNASYVRLIEKLFALFETYPETEFLIGNGEHISPQEKRMRGLEHEETSIYNAAHLFQGRTRKGVYYKNHLVPFTEYFPYKNIFPRFYRMLKENDVHFWLRGKELTLLEGNKARYATPICFEDGFGLQNAQFVRKGAQVIVNITNDAWSRVETNAMQHLQLSILRAVENRRSVVRSTNAGMTATIDPNGTITAMLPSFRPGSINEDVSLYETKPTLYTRFGDWFAISLLVISSISLIWALVLALVVRLKAQGTPQPRPCV